MCGRYTHNLTWSRMPVVLEESQFEDWMREPPELAAEMMKSYGGVIDIWEVGQDIGNVCNNKPELLDRVALI
jgi:putative SOS response-associated peptidase YedK